MNLSRQPGRRLVPAKALMATLVASLCCLTARSAVPSLSAFFVANAGSNTVQEFASDGSQSTFASAGLNEPMGLAMDVNGNLFVSNFGNNTILKFDSSGDGSLFANMGLSNPKGMVFNTQGDLFVANFGSSTIEEFNTSGHGSVFASVGVYQPYDVAIDPVTGDIFVSNNNGTIEKFNSSGQGMLFASGLSGPVGLAFDSAGNLYVAEYNGDEVDKFTPMGHKTLFAGTGAGNNPVGLIFDNSGDLLVSCASGVIEDFGPNAPACSILATNQNSPWFFAMPVPEPSSSSLIVIGLGGLLGFRKLRTRAS